MLSSPQHSLAPPQLRAHPMQQPGRSFCLRGESQALEPAGRGSIRTGRFHSICAPLRAQAKMGSGTIWKETLQFVVSKTFDVIDIPKGIVVLEEIHI